MNTRTIGVDQSYTHTGWVVTDVDGSVVAFGVITSDPEEDIYLRAASVAEQINEVIHTHNPGRIHLEGLPFGQIGNATRDLAGLLFVVITQVIADFPAMPYQVIAPTSVKKHATGSGKATKPQMIEALPPEVAWHFIDAGYKKTTGLADLADAYWLSQVPPTSC